jgi:ABC-type cobalt transport system, permease component CbiQ and related transporters
MDSRVFGKFNNRGTFVHKLDSRLKVFLLIALMVVVFLNYGDFANSFFILGIITVFIAIVAIITRISFKSFIKSLSALWFMMLFLIIINCLIPYGETTHIMIQFPNGFCIYYESLFNALRVGLRIILMIVLTMILTSSTSPLDITYAFEWYLTPLKIFKFPTQVISMTISLALRFIPTLLEEAQRIMRAQTSRGVDYNRGFISKKVKSITTLIIPLLVSCFSRSDELALAMDARGYDPYGVRSRYRSLKFSLKDLFTLIFLLAFLGFFIYLCVLASNYNVSFLDFLFHIGETF